MLTLAVIGWLIAVVEWVFLKYPTKLPPLFEKGHRGYEVPDQDSRKALLEVLALGGLKPVMRFKIGPTDQTLMNDGYTVVNLHDHTHLDSTAKFSGTFISLVTDNPEYAGQEAARIMGEIDKTTKLACLPMLEPRRSLIPVYSHRLGLTVTFRQHAMKLGKPPGQIPI